MYSKIKNHHIEIIEWEYFRYAILIVLFPLFLLLQFLLLPEIPFRLLHLIQQKNSIIYNYMNVYPVIVEHNTFSKPKKGQIPVYSSITSGGSGGITKEVGFHTLTNSDELLIYYFSQNIIPNDSSTNKEINQKNSLENPNSQNTIDLKISHSGLKQERQKISKTLKEQQELPTKIPANYRFRNDFALRWDNSPQFAIASVELKGYKYFRDMLRQIRENFAPPGLNLVWRDSAGVVVSQPIKPQIVRVLFLLDYDGTVRDVKIVSSMGQKPVDEACIRVLLNHNFGPPPPEIFEHGNIFGINFIFPPVY
ncbi:MAG: hypothetical protein KatS3mg068_2700 [Candidatus Sericytochromatia bacterium]|nr:MAG: hypothetical protein KatS3mg068_2700 [Candidatus Sericytochromatia bacterium]GIX40872.1 MAG: hypothetical protein KatS3mg129_0605 [Leptospiraceae bacterium]